MPSINPFEKRKVQQPPQVVDQEKQKELLARVTSGGRPAMQTPISAVPQAAGVTGNPPLPTGRIVGHTAPSSLTDIERQTLTAMGWTPDIQLPTTHEGMKALQTEIENMRAVEVPLPVPANTPPLKVNTVSMDSLSAEAQDRFRKVIQNIGVSEEQKAAQQRAQQEAMNKETQIRGMGAASGLANKAMDEFRAKVQAAAQEPVETPQAPQPQAQQTATLPPDPTQSQAQAKVPRSETGVDAVLTHCPHCEWDLGSPGIPEPTYQEKISFLHCILGEKTYVQEMPLFNGTVTVAFRTLTTREVDVVYKQAYRDRQEGKLSNDLDYWEHINRYRMMLQLSAFKSTIPNGPHRDLPDGYSKSTNPLCTGTWVTEEKENEMSREDTGLPQIEEWIIENVLKTETVFRMVNNTCNRFNRLVAKMEAMADNADFWKPTEE